MPGSSLTLRDLLSGGSVTVQERLGSRSLRRWDVIAARLALPAGASGKPEIEDLLPLPAYAKDALVAEVNADISAWAREHKRGPGVDDREFFKSYVPRFHQQWLAAVLKPPIPKVVFAGGEEALITRSWCAAIGAAPIRPGRTCAIDGSSRTGEARISRLSSSEPTVSGRRQTLPDPWLPPARKHPGPYIRRLRQPRRGLHRLPTVPDSMRPRSSKAFRDFVRS